MDEFHAACRRWRRSRYKLIFVGLDIRLLVLIRPPFCESRADISDHDLLAVRLANRTGTSRFPARIVK